MIDLESVKERADLLAIIGHDTELKKAGNSGGGEYNGPCSMCGGRDRLVVQPQAHRWLCRHCTDGKWDTVIGYIARRNNLDPKNYKDLAEIARIAVGELPTTNIRREPEPEPAYPVPGADWQALAGKVDKECQAALWETKYIKVLEYLRDRGLRDETIKLFQLGYNPEGRKISGEYWLDQGITIPCNVRGKIWYIKVRRGKGEDPKYRCMGGSKPKAIYNADQLPGSDLALFCEGEFDCMIAHQALNKMLPCVTLGAAGYHPDLAIWGAWLLPLRVILAAYDADQAGQEGAQGLYEIAGDRVKLASLPEGYKDINDYFKAGGSLWKWIKPYLDFYQGIGLTAENALHEGK